MNKKAILIIAFTMMIGIGAGIALAQDVGPMSPTAGLVGSAFTYQGTLTDGGSPASGSYDFQFNLYDAPSGGGLLGTVSVDDLLVSNGLFTVQLDFGASVFNGYARYLEIKVRPGASGGSYTPLTPLQRLTAAPYALYSLTAKSAEGLRGYQVSSTAPLTDQVLKWDGGQWAPADVSGYGHVLVVAQSGGDFTSIQSALDSIAGAGAGNTYLVWVAPGIYTEIVTMKEYVDIQGAGELQTIISSESVSIDSGTLMGADNAELRFLTVENVGGMDYATAIYNNSASPRLTHVSISASGGSNATGIVNTGASSPAMTDLIVSASGADSNNYAVKNYFHSSPVMKRVSVSAAGGERSVGIYNYNFSSPQMTYVTASASGGSEYNYAVDNYSYSSPEMEYITASASGASSHENCGVIDQVGSTAEINHIKVDVSGSSTRNIGISSDLLQLRDATINVSGTLTSTNYGVSSLVGKIVNGTITVVGGDSGLNYGVQNSGIEINGSVINVSGGITSTAVDNFPYMEIIIEGSTLRASEATYQYGIYNNPGYIPATLYINNSQVAGSTSTVQSDASFYVYIGASLLDGGSVINNTGTITCAGVYDENYTFYDSTCP